MKRKEIERKRDEGDEEEEISKSSKWNKRLCGSK